MKKVTLGLFASRIDAEAAINKLHRDLDIDTDDISYVYRNDEGETKEVDADDISPDTVGEKAGKGAKVGGVLGAIAGLGAAAGIIPVIGPVLAAGPILATLGIGGMAAGAVGGAATGAAAGGLIGALAGWGVKDDRAKEYADRVQAGDILVAVQSDDEDSNVVPAMMEAGAMEVEEYPVST